MLVLTLTENNETLQKEFKNLKEIQNNIGNDEINYQMLRQIYEISMNKRDKRTSKCKVNDILEYIKIEDKVEEESVKKEEPNNYIDLFKKALIEEIKPNENQKKRGRPKKLEA